MGFPFSSGDVLTAADLNGIGSWTDFTPSVSTLSVGNGQWVTAKWAVVNKIMFIDARFDFGSTTSLSGLFRIDTPGGYSLDYNNISAGLAVYNDRGLGDFVPGVVQPDPGGNQFRLVTQEWVSGWGRGEVDTNTPFTWASTDRIWFSCWAVLA